MLEFFKIILLIENFEAFYSHTNYIGPPATGQCFNYQIGNAVYTAHSTLFEHDLGKSFTRESAIETAKRLCNEGIYIENGDELIYYSPLTIKKARIIKIQGETKNE